MKGKITWLSEREDNVNENHSHMYPIAGNNKIAYFELSLVKKAILEGNISAVSIMAIARQHKSMCRSSINLKKNKRKTYQNTNKCFKISANDS